jgi:hypothetical protein
VSVEDDKRSGRPSTGKTTENVEKIRELINEDRCRTIHELADNAEISYGVCQEILTENLNVLHCSFIMTTHPATYPWKSQSSWQTTTWLSFPILPTCQT